MTPSQDDVAPFGALCHQHRREILGVLADATPPLSLEDLAAELVPRADVTGGSALTRLERTKTVLHHVHLPKLHRYVEYDWESNELRGWTLPRDPRPTPSD